MANSMSRVVVVGGGTAGWLTAAVVSAERRALGDHETHVTLIESPDIPTIGVGEGTWPSLRLTLKRIGLPESDLFRHADASFKQGTRFVGWTGDDRQCEYLHPFSLPAGYASTNLAPLWLSRGGSRPFADFVTPQAEVVRSGLAPKQVGMPDYGFAVNYAYHLDAVRFADLLREHAIHKLGVRHIQANVTAVHGAPQEDIHGVELDTGDVISGSLFVDCTGQRALLLNGHYGVALEPVDDVLFNDRAIAVQVPHRDANSPIASTTVSTATEAGWVWDIALQSRRGIGHVYSSRFASDVQARRMLEDYLKSDAQLDTSSLDDSSFRVLSFAPGYREKFWVRNCVAVGLSAGFVEPLEASAIALIEQSAASIGRQLPRERSVMDVVARGFNEKMHYHWQRIVEFLKLHYAVSQRRGSAYWQAHTDPRHWPSGLADKLVLWQQQSPYHQDAPMLDELFPSASYQYVLYGSGFRPSCQPVPPVQREHELLLDEVEQQRRAFSNGLVENRKLIEEVLIQHHV